MSEKLTIASLTPSEFRQRVPEITIAFADAMRNTPPWNMEIYKPATEERFREESETPDFGIVIAQENTDIAGISSFVALETTDIHDNLHAFTRQLSAETGIKTFVNIQRTFVTQNYRGRHLATDIRRSLLQQIQEMYPDGAIVTTQHYSTNLAIIRSSQELGFQPTGIKQYAWDNSGKFDEHWYKVIPPRV